MRNRSTKTLVLLLALSLAPLAQAEKKAIRPEGIKPGGPYTPGIIAGKTLYVAGQVGRDKSGNYPESFEEEVKLTLESVGTILKAAGYGFEDAVAVQVYLTDITLFDRMNKVYMTYFPEPRPARTTVGVASLVGKAKIEITVTAVK
jgi:2-iminobutanoate/2-iminopropanoate deaminase